MKILELLNSKVEVIELDDSDPGYYSAKAKINGRVIEFYADKSSFVVDGKKRWTVEFSEEQPKKGVNFRHKLTGSGGEFEVFAFIKQQLDALIKKRDPDTLVFTASKDHESRNNRASLYKKMVEKYAASAGYSFELKTDGSDVKFVLEKR